MTRVLIDCDPGHDDAMAILYAAKHLDLVAITTVHGNAPLTHTTRNALSICTLAGLKFRFRPAPTGRWSSRDCNGRPCMARAASTEPTCPSPTATSPASMPR